ncbi:MAG: hypothetical protein NTZ44_03080 [Candidatus Nomurabacteria bacterium]|nr:hypothetical protein [Candidatus Nomurabacteria bacterium]
MTKKTGAGLTTDKKFTLADLQKLSEETQIPLTVLQKEYGVYEFHFSSCTEAVKEYKSGYRSCPFPSIEDGIYDKPEVIAFHKAWKEISLTEQTNVTKLSFEESLMFIQVCYPHGEQLVSLIKNLRKHIGKDIPKIVRFIKEGQTFTFYKSDECPVKALKEYLMKKVEVHYDKKISKAKSLEQLLFIEQEIYDYKFTEVRPFPIFFEILWQRKARTAKKIDDLSLVGNCCGHEVLRWRELYPKATIAEALPTLREFLLKIWQAHKPDDVYSIIRHFFSKCENDRQARSLLDMGRGFFPPQENYDRSCELYEMANERIYRKQFPNPRLKDMRIISNSIYSDSYKKEIEKLWIKKTEKALTQPIHNFGVLYEMAHKSLQEKVLRVWNEWGLKQIEGIETWEELSQFNYSLLPSPQVRRGRGYYIWAGNRDSFSAFIVFLNKIIPTVDILGNKTRVLDSILKFNDVLTECHMWDLLQDELQQILLRIFEENQSVEELWALHEKVSISPAYSWKKSDEMIIDEILKKDPSAINKVFTKVKQGDPLFSKYLKIKVAQIT